MARFCLEPESGTTLIKTPRKQQLTSSAFHFNNYYQPISVQQLTYVSPVQRIRNDAANCLQKTPGTATSRALICRVSHNVLAARNWAISVHRIARNMTIISCFVFFLK